MPLIHSSKKSMMGPNIKKEMAAGKPQKQAIAIAYSVMRKAKGKKMAMGGYAEPESYNKEQDWNGYKESDRDDLEDLYDVLPGHYAKGGMVDDEPVDMESLQFPMEDDGHGVSGEPLREATGKPDEDEDRMKFLRSYLTHRSLRKRV